MPQVADGVAVRWIDVAAPWLTAGRRRRDRHAAGAGRRRTRAAQIRRHQGRARPRRGVRVRADRAHRSCPIRRGRRPSTTTTAICAPSRRPHVVYRIAAAPLDSKAYFGGIERGLRDHLARSLTIELPANTDLKLYGRPGESPTDFAARCDAVADERAATEIAKLRDKYEAKATRIRDEIAAAEDRVDVLQAEAHGKRNDELLSTAGSILGDLLGGRSRSRTLRSLGSAAGRRGRTAAAGERVDAAQGKVRPPPRRARTTSRPSSRPRSPRSTPDGRPPPNGHRRSRSGSSEPTCRSPASCWPGCQCRCLTPRVGRPTRSSFAGEHA